MKLIQEVQDVGADRGILVTTSYFTPDAESTARGFPIDLWEYNKVKELLAELSEAPETLLPQEKVLFVAPIIEIEQARKMVKEDILEEGMIYYPYYEVDFELLQHTKEGLFRKKIKEAILSGKVLIDAVAGAIVSYDRKSGISVVMPILTSLELSRDELEALKVLTRTKILSASALASQLSWSDAKARKAIQGLISRGLIKATKVEKTTYYSFPKPRLENLRSLSDQISLKEGKLEIGIPIKPKLSQPDFEETLKTIWDLKITGQKLVYYPFYILKVSKKGVEEIKAFDLFRKEEVKGELQRIFAQMIFSGAIALRKL